MLDAEKKEWFCNKCHIGYFPNKGQKVKRANKFEALDQEPNVLVSIVGHDPQLRPRKSPNPNSFEFRQTDSENSHYGITMKRAVGPLYELVIIRKYRT